MVLRDQLVAHLHDYLQVGSYKDGCPNGLQIEGKHEIKKIALSVSADIKSITRAIEWGADALIVHHGLLWKYSGARPLVGAYGKRFVDLIKNNCNLFAYHLPLDGHLELGNAAMIAKKLNLSEIEPFGQDKGAHLGVKGHWNAPISLDQLRTQLEQILHHQVLMTRPENKENVHSIGIITGGANNYWSHAYEEGLDAFLTGEISEYNWHDAQESGIVYCAGGHHATERYGIQSLGDYLHQKYQVDLTFIDSDNPA